MARPVVSKTAIKIPGKRTRNTSNPDIAARKKFGRPPGRPLKLTDSGESATFDGLTNTHKKRTVRSLKNIKSKRDMSLLERLPTELLEEIFFYSMNLDLPRSSPVIGGKLSSEVVYIQTVLAAFENTWEWYYASPPEFSFSPIHGDDKLQTSILRCRWASLPILLQSQDIYMRRINAHGLILEPILLFPESKAKGRNREHIALSSKTAAARFDDDFAAFLHAASGSEHVDLLQIYDVGCSLEGVTDLAKGTEIPHSLLLGPWTKEMIRHLYWLVKSGATLNWLTSTSGEAACLGFRDALQAGEFPVILLLMWAGLVHKLDTKMLIWALHNVGSNKIAIMGYLLASADLTDVDESTFRSELEAERDKASWKVDQDRLAFLDAVKDRLEVHKSG
ncbi:hypothetical protein OIDMADRAFT_19303, partial [Oidiodendron maius Zn]